MVYQAKLIVFTNNSAIISRYVFKSWEAHHTIPSLEFSFIFITPKPRYERIISERDRFGRIVHSKQLELY